MSPSVMYFAMEFLCLMGDRPLPQFAFSSKMSIKALHTAMELSVEQMAGLCDNTGNTLIHGFYRNRKSLERVPLE